MVPPGPDGTLLLQHWNRCVFPTKGPEPHPTVRISAASAMSFYGLLGVTTDATTEEIKLAFKRRALQVHPDKGPAEYRSFPCKKACVCSYVNTCHVCMLLRASTQWQCRVFQLWKTCQERFLVEEYVTDNREPCVFNHFALCSGRWKQGGLSFGLPGI